MTNKGLYHNFVANVSVECELSLLNGNLYIYLNNQKKDLSIWQLKHFTACKFNNAVLEISYGDPVTQRVECSGAIAHAIYDALTGNVLPERKESFYKRNKALILIAGFCLVFIFWAWFFVIPWLAEKSVSLVPVDAEIEMGKTLSEAMMTQEKVNDSASYFSNRFVAQLQLDDTYPIRVEVIESDEINAFALPGGRIFIYSGILKKMESYEALVALLGHEISHVTNRHSLKSIFRTAAAGLIISSFLGDASSMSAGVLNQLNEFKQLDYSRDLETEADDKGYEIMLENKTNPHGMLELLKVLKKAGGEQPRLMKYLSTHPDTDSRIDNIASKEEINVQFPLNPALEAYFNQIKQALSEDK